MMSASHIVAPSSGSARGRSTVKSGANELTHKRSASVDCLDASTCKNGQLLSFLQATVKNKMLNDSGDEDDDEDDFDEEEEQLPDNVTNDDVSSHEGDDGNDDDDGSETRKDDTSQLPVSKTDSHDEQNVAETPSQSPPKSEGSPSSSGVLTSKLRELLDIPDGEELIGQQPCWLMRNVLLQGHLYVTQRKTCFFAFLPSTQTVIVRSGSLNKRARLSHRYQRFWFVLKYSSFSYYYSASEVYFPTGTIDLRYAIKVEISPSDPMVFILTTEQRSYTFKADSAHACSDWVQSIQKEIFKSRNKGDSVKIIIPNENIIDVEHSSLFGVAMTIKIRAIDSDETFAIDEYVLAFFRNGDAASEAINKAMGDNAARDLLASRISLRHTDEHLPKIGKIEDTTGANELERTIASHDEARRGRSYLATALGRRTPRTLSRSNSKDRLASPTTLSRSSSIEPKSPLSQTSSPRRSREDLTPERLSPTNTYSKEHGALGFAPTLGTNAIRRIGSAMRENSPFRSRGSATSLNTLEDHSFHHEHSPPQQQRSESHHMFGGMVSKVTEMWGGGVKHYTDGQFEESTVVPESKREHANERFRKHFSLAETESLVVTYYAHLSKAVPIYGKLYLSQNYLCFRSLLPGTSTKMILPLSDIENVVKEKGFNFVGYSGLVIVIHGHEETFFEFSSSKNRDECEVVILRGIDKARDADDKSVSKGRIVTYEDALRSEYNVDILPIITDNGVSVEELEHIKNRIPVKSLQFTCLTIGSRGDVQPFIALCKGLLKQGHKCRIATHAEFKDWIEENGIEFREVAGDPGELMKIMVDHGMFSVSFIREATAKFRTWIDELLTTSLTACQGSDVLIESPSAMAGIHIAEALRIPYFRAFTMPWSRTRAYPHAFIVPEQKMGGSYNYLTYVMFDNVLWKGISGQVNKWRKRDLGLGRSSLDQMQQYKAPFMYNVSPSVFVPPVDFPDWVKVCGYWFLNEGTGDYNPPNDITDFIAAARRDGKKLVYIGFGSIVVSNPQELTQSIIEAVVKADVRCILNKGWSDRLQKTSSEEKNATVFPSSILSITNCPHDWLFPQMDAIVHHGGSGTTGASLRAGKPTIIKPFFGDQFFYAGRVEDLGVGIYLKKLNVSHLLKALKEATTNERIISRATAIGDSIQHEDGVSTSIRFIYKNMDYARQFSCSKQQKKSAPNESPKNVSLSSCPSKMYLSTTSSVGGEDSDGWTLVK